MLSPLLALWPKAVAASLAAGALALDRKALLQSMIARPLPLSVLLGLLLGDGVGGLGLGCVLELLYLGGVNLGGSVPDHEALLSVGMVCAAVPAGEILGTGVTPQLSGLALLILAPLGALGRRFELAHEERNARFVDRALARARAHHPDPARLQLRALVGTTTGPALAALLCVLGAPLLVELLARLPPQGHGALRGAWLAAEVLGAASAVRTIRDRNAGVLALVGLCLGLSLFALQGAHR